MMKRLDKVEVSENELSEYDGNRKVISISKDTIKTISLEYGFAEERPVISIIIGMLILVFGVRFGLIPVMHILIDLFNGKQVHGQLGIFAFATPLFLLGVWFVLKIFRYRHFLKVVTNTSTRKLAFDKTVEKTSIESFVKECNRAFGYKILLKN